MKNGGGFMENKDSQLRSLKVGDEAWFLKDWDNDVYEIIHVRILDIYNKTHPIRKEYHVMMDNKCHIYEVKQGEIFHTEVLAKFGLINKYLELKHWCQKEIKRLDKELGIER